MGSEALFGPGQKQSATWAHRSSEANLHGPSRNRWANPTPLSTWSSTGSGWGHQVAEEPQDLPRETGPMKAWIN